VVLADAVDIAALGLLTHNHGALRSNRCGSRIDFGPILERIKASRTA